MDLSTTWLGFSLPHPFLAGAGPVADDLDRVRRLEDAGIAAIVLRSLFEEQLDTEALAHHGGTAASQDPSGEALSYFAEPDGCLFGPDEYLEHLRRVKEAVRVPVIASLNGYTQGGWIDYARQIARAGADALELNLYGVATDTGESSAELEAEALQMVREVRRAVRLPLAVKLLPYYTALPNFARLLQEAGTDGLVLFNRCFEPDVDLEALEVRPHLELSNSHELLLRLHWLAILSGQLDCDLAISGGVHSARDAIKAVLCGAGAVQLVAALIRGGPGALTELRTGVEQWLEENGHQSLAQLRGRMDLRRTPDPKVFERGNYMRILQAWRLE
jgi:dihydroorotate dehydrogenase (fumarate)